MDQILLPEAFVEKKFMGIKFRIKLVSGILPYPIAGIFFWCETKNDWVPKAYAVHPTHADRIGNVIASDYAIAEDFKSELADSKARYHDY